MYKFKELKHALKLETSTLPKLKVALLGDTATQFLAIALRGEGILRGYDIELWEAGYSQVERQIMDASSDYYAFAPDYTIVFQSSHKLLDRHALYCAEKQRCLAEERLDFIRLLCQQGAGHIIYYNYPDIDDTIFGSYGSKVEESFSYQLAKLNYELMKLSQEYQNLFLCDLAGIFAKYGRNYMFDSSIYINTEMIFSLDALPIVASRTIDIIAAVQGKFKKCLILDLDNTVWGGVVGDDGWESIQIGHGIGIGKAFTEFQQWVKKLKNRGVIICVCSKNDEDKAKEPFEKNPEMVLKLDDIAVFVANWENKADNIRTIQSILNIGFDSMVFLDDNPFERNMVRENVPGITIPELPEDSGEYLEFLYSQNLFETASFSSVDKDRTKHYQEEARRVSNQKSFTNEADFLKSLEMLSIVKGFDKFNTPRVAQLSQRSNQFNLRTVRYTESDIANIQDSEKYATFSFTLEDKFGDNGLICVVICEKKDDETLFIDTWFMSCRVLKRGMENFTLNTIVAWAKSNGFKRIIGEYLPTAKNGMVEQHYPDMGFEKLANTATALYSLDVATYKNRESYIRKKSGL